MELTWDLTELFNNNDDFYQEIDNIKVLIDNIKKYENIKLDENSLFELLNKKWEIKESANNVLVYGSLMYYKNINSSECMELKRIAEIFNNEVNLNLGFIDRKILCLTKKKIDDFIKKNPRLEIYRLSLNNLFRLQSHVQNDNINKEIKENIDNINAQLKLYNDMLRDIKYGEVNDNGNIIEITPSNFSKYICSRNRETRKQTYLIVNKNFSNLQNDFASILNTIFNYRIKNAELENYNSVLEKVLFEENINVKIIETLIESVNNNIPLIQKYLELKAKFLNIELPHLYDFSVSLDSDIKIKFSIEEAIEIIKNALKPLGSEYLEVVNHLLEHHVDAELDENKHQSITFSWHTYSFMNFRGSYIDLKNMIHELGHIVNYYLSKENQPFIYEDSTIFVGETSSIVNEVLLNRYLYQNAKTKEEKIFYLSKEIENYFTSIFKQTMYTEFENYLYNTKLSQELTTEIISQKYGDLLKKYYGKKVVYDDISSIEWTRLGHLYRWSYYPYKYATGLLIANVVVDSLVDSKTLSNKQYLKFLTSGSSYYSLDLLKMVNVDFMNSNIIDNGFKVLKKDINELEKIIKL